MAANTKTCITGYSDDFIRPLCILLPQIIGYVKCFDDNKTMPFVADDKELLKKYIEIWEKISDLIGKKFDSEPVYGDKYIKTKIQSYDDNIKTNF